MPAGEREAGGGGGGGGGSTVAGGVSTTGSVDGGDVGSAVAHGVSVSSNNNVPVFDFPECPQYCRSELWTSFVLAGFSALKLKRGVLETAFHPHNSNMGAFAPLPRLSLSGPCPNLSLAAPPGVSSVPACACLCLLVLSRACAYARQFQPWHGRGTELCSSPCKCCPFHCTAHALF